MPEPIAEFDLVTRILARIGARDDVVLGIGDDGAVLQAPPGQQLVVVTDTLNAGVHFPHRTPPADIGWKALAVNLSDLAAMGATPAWCTLAMSLPDVDPDWVEAFLDGFTALGAQHRVALVGGDTTRGPLSICVTAIGFIKPGHALRRDGARVGDDLWVTGTLGDAAAALAQWQAIEQAGAPGIDATLRARLDRPTPRVAFGQALARAAADAPMATLASACIDLSDGLFADLCHVLDASRAGAEVWIDALPASPALRALHGGDALMQLQAAGGDDYELCFCSGPQHRDAISAAAVATRTAITRIGRITPTRGIQARDAQGRPWLSTRPGFEHFP